MPSTITITPATLPDAPALAALNVRAFLDDKLYQTGFRLTPASPDSHLRAGEKFRQAAFERNIRAPGMHLFKAVDEDDDGAGRIVGYVVFAEPADHHRTTGEKKEDGVVQPGIRELPDLPPHVDLETCEAIERNIKAAQARVLEGRGDVWYLGGMAVHPSHQRRGIAQQLLSHGLRALVDAEGGDCHLGASPVGKKLYERNGFVAREEAEVAPGCFMCVMLRPGRKAHDNGGSQ